MIYRLLIESCTPISMSQMLHDLGRLNYGISFSEWDIDCLFHGEVYIDYIAD